MNTSPLTLHVARDGQTIGQFPMDTAKQCLESQIILPTDVCWHEGMTEWKPVSEIVSVDVPPLLPAPVPPVVQSIAQEPPVTTSSKSTAYRNWAIAGGTILSCLICGGISTVLIQSVSTDTFYSNETTEPPVNSHPVPQPVVNAPVAKLKKTICNQFELEVTQALDSLWLVLKTDLPTGIPIGLRISRGYYQDGTGFVEGTANEQYSIAYFDILRKPLGGWKKGMRINLNDAMWVSDLKAQATKMRWGIKSINNEIEIRAIVNLPDCKKYNIDGNVMTMSEFGFKILESEIVITRPIRVRQ